MDISVIIPSYNSEKTIQECIDAVSKQNTDCLYEIIVIDDASLDNTENILKMNNNIILLRNEKNMGQSFSRNLGANTAKGRYIFFIDSDVVISENAINECYNYMLKNKDQRIKGIQGVFMIYNRYNNWSSILYNALQHLVTSSPELSNHVNTSCLFIEKDYFMKMGGFDNSVWYLEDGDFSRRMINRQDCLLKRNIISFKHIKYVSFLKFIRLLFIGGKQFTYLKKAIPVKSDYFNKYKNNLFENNIKRVVFASLFVFGSLFIFPIIYLIPMIFLTDIKTTKVLYYSNRNLFFVIWGVLLLHFITIVIMSGVLCFKIFGFPLNDNDKLKWLN